MSERKSERYRALSNLLEQTPCVNPEWRRIIEKMEKIIVDDAWSDFSEPLNRHE